MILCAAGDIHGAIDRLYFDVLAFEANLGVRFDHVLHVGDFGIWPDARRIGNVVLFDIASTPCCRFRGHPGTM